MAWLRAVVDEHEDPRERVLGIFDALHHWHHEATFRGCAMVNASTQSPEGPASSRAASHLERYHTLLTELAHAAGVVDPERAARRLLILIEGATTVAAIGGDRDAAADARALARMVLESEHA
jgi:hypothetical protein